MEKLHVISVGGSLIVPGQIDSPFLSAFKHFIYRRVEEGERFILVAGGGRTARNYQVAAAEIGDITSEEKDWLGIHSTRLNAHLLRTIFKNIANPKVVRKYDKEKLDSIDFNEKILVGGGWKPGWSTDYVAVLLAEQYKAKSVVNLSNIEYACLEDPKVNPETERYKQISWKDFREIVGDSWDPGMSAPFDPIASRKAQELDLKVAIMNGKKLYNLEHYLKGQEFRGTLIGNGIETVVCSLDEYK